MLMFPCCCPSPMCSKLSFDNPVLMFMDANRAPLLESVCSCFLLDWHSKMNSEGNVCGSFENGD